MGVPWPVAVLRLTGGLLLVVGVAAFGYHARPLWVLPVLALIFTVAFGLDRWRAWSHAKATGRLGKAAVAQVGTLAVQLVVVGVFYLVGRGIGSLAGRVPADGVDDFRNLALLAVFGIGNGLAAMLLERRAAAPPAATALPGDDPDVPRIIPEPLTEDRFWSGPHYSQADAGTPGLSDARISVEEARLGVALPARLRRLYALQNGGSGMNLWVPCAQPMHNAVGGWINPFSGYNDMLPLSDVDTLHRSISAYAYDDQVEMFPEGSAHMVVLAQWYRETLFLDYRGGGGDAPRVGFVDFDAHGDLSTGAWEDRALWWENFDAFFADLRWADENE